ncbi:hypothetical protein FJ651_09410 [Paucihalobacter ruber]|uniref:Uncharacterized protein n=1 Tax=Paucihalobacter ruber TaxID=2567861 RepID=A0A506PM57_9FLAO|nr:hypothetical protein [Paucihalobacter ruber]TPV33300.1 hypothetical protein FJ651_09410 [Paucihalobacter ruber]
MSLSFKITAAILSVLILLNCTIVTVTYAYYELDPIGFIEKLCVNKETPEAQCKGKCQLMTVSGLTDQQKNQPEAVFEYKEIVLFNSVLSLFQIESKTMVNNNVLSYYQNLYKFLVDFDSFHPPQFS